MAGLVPVDTQPEFDHSLVPVDHNPFDIGPPLIGDGGQFSAGMPWANRAVDAMTTPRARDEQSPVAYRTSSPLVNITQQDLDDATSNAMAFSGGGLGIKAYHGSPHDFDAFSMDKIGTGEGAQAYGHGMYFAENEGVAGAYKKNLAPASADITPSWKGDGWQVTTRDGGNFDRQFFQTKEEAEAHAAKFNKGHMYEVNINADPEHFLDWDKVKMADQPEAVRKVFTDILGQEPNFLGAGMKIAQSRGIAPAEISRRLNEAGVPGIKYLDQGSRAAAEGSRNYVVFDDKLVNIIKKYGIVGLPAGLAGAASQQFMPVDHDPEF